MIAWKRIFLWQGSDLVRSFGATPRWGVPVQTARVVSPCCSRDDGREGRLRALPRWSIGTWSALGGWMVASNSSSQLAVDGGPAAGRASKARWSPMRAPAREGEDEAGQSPSSITSAAQHA